MFSPMSCNDNIFFAKAAKNGVKNEVSLTDIFMAWLVYTINIHLAKFLTLPVVFLLYLRNDYLKFFETWHLS